MLPLNARVSIQCDDFVKEHSSIKVISDVNSWACLLPLRDTTAFIIVKE